MRDLSRSFHQIKTRRNCESASNRSDLAYKVYDDHHYHRLFHELLKHSTEIKIDLYCKMVKGRRCLTFDRQALLCHCKSKERPEK